MNAPFHHPFWNNYLITLTDLTTKTDKEPIIHHEGATHELIVNALNPHVTLVEPVRDDQTWAPLTPPNMAYQFVADSDEAARELIQTILDRVRDGNMSLDTDGRLAWNAYFRGIGMSLLKT